ncbi:MAG: hypothetical protein SGI88_02910 [Candidatus Hydrogenedentes bacterium]|nr:hypothetical protein [Candidatus Hydrogenedentota bacterium]
MSYRPVLRTARTTIFLCGLLVAACDYTSPSSSDVAGEDDLPVSLEELSSWYSAVPEAENAALLLIRAGDSHRDPDAASKPGLPLAGDAKLPPPGMPLTNDMRAAIGQYLVSNDIALGTIARAAKLDKSRFPIDLTKGMDTDLAHLASCRTLVRLQCLSAVAKANSGDAAAAHSRLRDVLVTSNALRYEPLLISQLVRITCHLIAAESIEYSADRVDFTEAQLAELQKLAGEWEDPELLYRAYVGERCLSVSWLSDPANAERDDGPNVQLPPEMYSKRGVDAVIKHYQMLFSASKLPSRERREELSILADAGPEPRSDSFDDLTAASLSPIAAVHQAHDADTATSRTRSIRIH